MKADKKAFTLIELLVVISIMAVLMAMLLPSLDRARGQALAVECQNRLKQWGLSFAMYTQANNDLFMRGWCGVAASEEIDGTPGNWCYEFSRPPHKVDPKMWFCPVATKIGWGRPPLGAWGAAWELVDPVSGETVYHGPYYGSYTINWAVNNAVRGRSIVGGNVFGEAGFWRTTQVRGANNIPVLMDGQVFLTRVHNNGWNNLAPEYDGVYQWPNDGTPRVCTDRHFGAINAVFMDWSVRKVRLKEIWTLKWNRRFDVMYGPAQGEWPEWMTPYPDP